MTRHPAFDGKPAWSPDGTALLFESTRKGVPNIWRLEPGGVPVQVTDHPEGARAPVWFHGGGKAS